ncbi:MAG TPA: PA2169 family four-helix-bundle protein [Vicinamibacterales bacterium]|nr:PA2169 family four-helix-bundle protein [Vicinamibacterales bacterium]
MNTIKALNELIELDYDAIEAYRAAIERIDSQTYKAALNTYCGDHERHTQNVGEVVRALGGTPAQGPDMKKYLTKGKVVIADLVGDDHAILTAMLMNEEVTNKAYEAALKLELGAGARSVVEANLTDERRHRAWIQAQLEAAKAKA